ncbi:MAG: hypothetical protein EOO24_61635, partial [Comamonadaceae bacterium]
QGRAAGRHARHPGAQCGHRRRRQHGRGAAGGRHRTEPDRARPGDRREAIAAGLCEDPAARAPSGVFLRLQRPLERCRGQQRVRHGVVAHRRQLHAGLRRHRRRLGCADVEWHRERAQAVAGRAPQRHDRGGRGSRRAISIGPGRRATRRGVLTGGPGAVPRSGRGRSNHGGAGPGRFGHT